VVDFPVTPLLVKRTQNGKMENVCRGLVKRILDSNSTIPFSVRWPTALDAAVLFVIVATAHARTSRYRPAGAERYVNEPPQKWTGQIAQVVVRVGFFSLGPGTGHSGTNHPRSHFVF
jgi:hypothetical protein